MGRIGAHLKFLDRKLTSVEYELQGARTLIASSETVTPPPTAEFINPNISGDVAVNGYRFELRVDGLNDVKNLHIFLDTDRTGFDGKELVVRLKWGRDGKVLAEWSDPSVPEGVYYPYVILWNEPDNQFQTYALGVLTVVYQVQNQAPVVDGGVDLRVQPGDTVTLSGNVVDVDGVVIGTLWTQVEGPSVHISDPTQLRIVFQAPEVTTATKLRFLLTATDDDGATGRDSVTVYAAP